MKTSSPTSPVSTPLKILLMGPPGSRKTTLMLQFPDIYVEDCDKNLQGPEKWLRDHGHANLSYAYNPVRYRDDGTMRDIDTCYESLCDDLKHMVSEPKLYEKFRVIGVDSLSHVNEFIIRHVLKLQNKTKKTYEMESRDWNPFKSFAYTLLVARLEEMNKHVICTCHEIKIVEAQSADNFMKQNIVGYEPFFQGKVGDTIGAFFTDIWRMEVRQAPGDKSETWIQTKHPKCEFLKNSLGMPGEINVTAGIKVLEPFLKGRITL